MNAHECTQINADFGEWLIIAHNNFSVNDAYSILICHDTTLCKDNSG